MVQRDQWDMYWGPKKIIFLIREIDDAAKAGASVESCRFVVLRSPRRRLGSELDMGSRLRRVRGRFDQWMQIKTGPQQCADNCHDPQKFSIQSSLGAPRIGACGLGDHPTSDLSQRVSASRSAPEKSNSFGPDGAPFPSKTSITRGHPVVAVAVSSDPILPQR